MALDYRLLGRLEVVRDGVPVDLGAFRQRALLAVLLANTGTVLSTDRLLDELWGETGGIDKQNSLWVYVSGLRGALEPGRPKRSEGTILLTRAPGYVIAVDREATDVGRFERAVAEARTLTEDDPTGASHVLKAALATWRGHAYEEFAYESWAQAEIGRLEELRVEATEDRIDADLRTGLARELVAELQGLVRQHPMRERFVTSLMLALYRSGRGAEALRACAALRRRLIGELGVEPSRAVRELEQRMLADDPEWLVDATARPRRAVPGLSLRGYELREELGRGAFGVVYRAYQPIVGREVAIKVIKPELADDPTFIRRFEAEAQLVAGLEHPHVVPLYDYWREPGAAYLVMRLVGTGSLADVLALGGLPTDRAATVFAQLSSALRAAHRNGVVHRDVKPQNILVDGDGNAYLTDFGLALGPDGSGPSLTVPYAAPEQLAGRPPSPATDVYSLAVVAATALSGMSGEYEQVRGALAPAVRVVLDRATAADPARRYVDAATFGRALVDALGVAGPAGPAVLDDPGLDNPYKGLRAFGAGDAGDFFGRERLVERLLARLGERGARGRFVAVVGPSGSGKSSVVRAGLMPALAQHALPSSDEWFRVEMTPAPHPFEELEAALLRIATATPAALLDVLLTPGGVRRAIHRAIPEDGQLVLVIDQFEELFTQIDEDTANRFMDELVDLVTTATARVRVVITLRADFYDRPLRHRGLGELLRDSTEAITPMTIDELEAAITGPAAKVGVDIDPAAVAEMVAEVVDRPGALPLLQYTLTELFEARTGRTITLAAYRSGGGVSRTLARRADTLLASLGPGLADTARNVLLRLVSVDDDGGAGAQTRRRALVAEVEELDDRGRVRQLLDTFGRHRLLSFDRDPVTRGPTVEISHEALLTEWTTLRQWIEDARDDLRTHRHLVAEMKAWRAADGSADYLLRGRRLDQVVSWAEVTTMGLRPAERQYLEASLAARTAEQRTRDEEAGRRTAAEARARRRTRQLVVAAVVVALVAGLASLAWVQREDARQAQTDLAGSSRAQRLANVSVNTLDRDPEVALLLAMEAVRATADLGYAVPEAIDATHWALQELGVQYDVAPDTPTAARFGPGGVKGVKGVWVLPVEELMKVAADTVDRPLSAEECRLYLDAACPDDVAVEDVGYLGGVDAYAGAVAADEAEVVVAMRIDLDSHGDEWQRNLDAVGARYGLRVRLVAIPNNLSLGEAAAQGVDADVFVLVAPGQLPELAEFAAPIDVRPFVDEAALLADYGPHLVSLGRIGADGTWPSDTGPIHGVMVGADSKALVWTREPEFTELGYRPPADWDSFIGLADTMVADGRTPLCLELESGDADGWPATDWVEMVVLRTAGPDVYDAWVRNEVPFDDPAVVAAIRTVGEMVHGPGYLDASPAATSRRGFASGLYSFATEPDSCLMTLFPSFLPDILEVSDPPVATFAFPAFGRGFDDAVVGGGPFAVAVADRPEIRALMGALAAPDWRLDVTGSEWPFLLPVNAGFDAAMVTNPVVGDIVTGIQAAVRSDHFRFDAADSMPPAVTAAFYAGMVRLFQEGSLDNLDELSVDIAADVEAVWAG